MSMTVLPASPPAAAITSAAASYGTARTTVSEAAAASANEPAAMVLPSSAATVRALVSSREAMVMLWPALAKRTARPLAMLPVPKMEMFMSVLLGGDASRRVSGEHMTLSDEDDNPGNRKMIASISDETYQPSSPWGVPRYRSTRTSTSTRTFAARWRLWG